jgi:hypothetical protein
MRCPEQTSKGHLGSGTSCDDLMIKLFLHSSVQVQIVFICELERCSAGRPPALPHTHLQWLPAIIGLPNSFNTWIWFPRKDEPSPCARVFHVQPFLPSDFPVLQAPAKCWETVWLYIPIILELFAPQLQTGFSQGDFLGSICRKIKPREWWALLIVDLLGSILGPILSRPWVQGPLVMERTQVRHFKPFQVWATARSGLPPIFVLLDHSHTHSFTDCLWLLSCNHYRIKRLWQRS